MQVRSEIPKEDCWNVEALYSSKEAWEKDFFNWTEDKIKNFSSQMAGVKGRLSEADPEKMAFFIAQFFDLDRTLTKLFTFAHLKYDENLSNDLWKDAYQRSVGEIHQFRQLIAWFEPEILQLDQKKLDFFLSSAQLAPYKIYLEKIIRLKPYTLSADQEKLLALAGQALETASRSFSAFNNADLKFPPIKDGMGNVCELTHAKYRVYLMRQDRALRKEAFCSVHESYTHFENTLCELIQGEIQRHVFEMRARGYHSSLEAALFPNQVDLKVYSALIETVRKHLPTFHRYLKLRKKWLGLEKLHLYDLHVSVVKEIDLSMNYEEASRAILKAVAPLGPEYVKDLEKGLLVDRWVDRYENAGKRSGAYSSGCFDSMPYILMNYQGTFDDAMTLAHEAGHSMQTFLSARHQPYQYAQYPIFVAEVASTYNEELLFRYLLERAETEEKKAFLINEKLDDIRATFFRQVMFAEFEWKLHEWVEKGIPLTPSLLKEEYRKLNVDYFGDETEIDPEIAIEWARIPHFYYNFYVYQYATGLSAAQALVERLFKEGESARLDYLAFLSAGSSAYPLELLKRAGVDMTKPDAISSTIRRFDQLVDELDQILEGRK